MAVLRVRDGQGTVHDLTVIRGEKGEAAQVDYTAVAPALKGKKTGNPVVIKDASPLYHEMTLKSDVGGAEVTVYGKNLLDLSQSAVFTRCLYDEETGKVTSNIEDSYYCSFTLKYLNDLFLATKGTPITFSVQNTSASGRSVNVVIYGTRTDGEEYQGIDGVNQSFLTFTGEEAFTAIDRVVFRFNRMDSKGNDQTTVLSDFQIEVGETVTPYEPYREPWTLAGSDEGNYSRIGLRDGQGMTLFADSGTLTAAYNRDLNKAIAAIEEAVL